MGVYGPGDYGRDLIRDIEGHALGIGYDNGYDKLSEPK